MLLATANSHKLLEVRAILGELPISLRSLEAFPEVVLPEEGDDYEANAVAKARAAARGAGRLALADDSGLEVEGLGGAPGPHSARFGGLAARPEVHATRSSSRRSLEWRRARAEHASCASRLWRRTMAGSWWRVVNASAGFWKQPRGRGGFDYDPIFEVEGRGKSLAELSAEDKNGLSHRGRAFRGLKDAIRARL